MLSAALITANNEKAEYMTNLDSAQFTIRKLELEAQNGGSAGVQHTSVSQNTSLPSTTASSPRKGSTAADSQLQLENSQLAQILADERMSSAQLQEQIDNLQDQLRKYAQKVQVLEAESSDRSESRTTNKSLYQENEENMEVVSQLAREKLKSASLNDQVLQLQAVVNESQLAESEEDGKLAYANQVIEHLNVRLQKELDARVELSEKYEELEVANAQLQAQSETINDYITLYREQRAALKQMQRESDIEREEVDAEKLELLELLVKQLLADRTMTSGDAPALNENEVLTATKIANVVHDVLDDAGVETEPLQLSIPYYG